MCGYLVGKCHSVCVCWCYEVGYVKCFDYVVGTECDFEVGIAKEIDLFSYHGFTIIILNYKFPTVKMQ